MNYVFMFFYDFESCGFHTYMIYSLNALYLPDPADWKPQVIERDCVHSGLFFR